MFLRGFSNTSTARADLIQVHLSSAIVTMQTTMDAQGVAYLIRQPTVLQHMLAVDGVGEAQPQGQ